MNAGELVSLAAVYKPFSNKEFSQDFFFFFYCFCFRTSQKKVLAIKFDGCRRKAGMGKAVQVAQPQKNTRLYDP